MVVQTPFRSLSIVDSSGAGDKRGCRSRLCRRSARWALAIVVLTGIPDAAAQSDDARLQFFESHVRPVLREHCLTCHNSQKRSGGLSLDHRAAWQSGGDSGAVIVPGNPDDSLMMRVIRHEEPGLEMPAKAPRLDDDTISRLAEWIRQGAFDPRDSAETLDTTAGRSWSEIRDERATWWSFQPLRTSAITGTSPTSAATLSAHIDARIDERLEQAGVRPAPLADRRTLIRRLSNTLTGLPPSPQQVDDFLNDVSPNAWERLVDNLLASPAFGERWARHWMDVVRYADTHGSEDDALLPNAWRYRDYLIRAFNTDVPFDQLIREHIAGDLITPRWNRSLNLNESVIGTAFWRFVEFNQTPVDVRREEIIVIDSQIDALGKAFQALTISCARCHDHKFDPISDEDYYALYGILRSTRSGLRIIDDPAAFTGSNARLKNLSQQLRRELVGTWQQQVANWINQIPAATSWLKAHPQQTAGNGETEPPPAGNSWIAVWQAALKDPGKHVLRDFVPLLSAEPAGFAGEWDMRRQDAAPRTQAASVLPAGARELFDLRQSLSGWKAEGAGLPAETTPVAGALSMDISSQNLIDGVLEPGYHTNVLSDRHAGVLRSPDFVVDDEMLSVLARGDNQARVRLVIENFQGDSLLFATVNPELQSQSLQWYHMTIRPQWRGLRAHLELLTRDDKPYLGVVKQPEALQSSNGRSSFGIARVVLHPRSVSLKNLPSLPDGLWEHPADSWEVLAQTLADVTRDSLQRWASGSCTSDDARWLTLLINQDLLTVPPDPATPLQQLVSQYRSAEQEIPVARRSPGVFEDHCPVDQEFLPRGNHLAAESPVPRRYLEVLGGTHTDYADGTAGRLRLADAIASPNNPLTARVCVNRVWHWVFGHGLVSTVDNFGRMGTTPTHPELLDELAAEFVSNRWSTKSLIRAMLLSNTWQRDSVPGAEAAEQDPGNALWSHAELRRCDAESLRDTMLFLTGRMRTHDEGPGTRVFYRTVLDANKQAPPGPLDGDNRRSLFLEVRRNFPNEFLMAFDFPRPSSPVGRRSITTVPAQSLVLLNDPFTIQQAERWAERVCEEFPAAEDRVAAFYSELLSRPPSTDERNQALALVAAVEADVADDGDAAAKRAWSLLAHAMFNLKEAFYLR